MLIIPFLGRLLVTDYTTPQIHSALSDLSPQDFMMYPALLEFAEAVDYLYIPR